MMERLAGEAASVLERLAKLDDATLKAHRIEPNAWRSVIDTERGPALKLVNDLGEKTTELNGSLDVLQREIRFQLVRWMSIVYHHRDQRRKSGKRYSEHLWATAEGAVKAGFIERTVVDGSIGHDVLEDVSEVKQGLLPVFFPLYLAIDSGWNSPLLQEQDDHIRVDISAITKPEIEDKVERNKAYLKLLIEQLLIDAKPIIIKLFDRLHNMRTLDAQAPDKQQSISKETLEVFVPLAKRLGLYEVQEELVRLCLKYLNPDLLKNYDDYMQMRLQKIQGKEGYWEGIKDKIMNKSKDEAQESELRGAVYVNQRALMKTLRAMGANPSIFFPNCVRSIKTVSHLLVSRFDHVDSEKSVETLSIADLKLSENDTVIDVVVLVESDEDIESTVRHIQSVFVGHEWKTKNAFGSGRGIMAKTHGPEYAPFSGKIFFRVNSVAAEARAKRGYFNKMDDFTIPPEVQDEARTVLEQSKYRDIRIVARGELLYPQITISTFIDGELREHTLPRGVTARDFIEKTTGQRPEGNMKVLISKGVLANRWEESAQTIDADSPLPHGYTIVVKK